MPGYVGNSVQFTRTDTSEQHSSLAFQWFKTSSQWPIGLPSLCLKPLESWNLQGEDRKDVVYPTLVISEILPDRIALDRAREGELPVSVNTGLRSPSPNTISSTTTRASPPHQRPNTAQLTSFISIENTTLFWTRPLQPRQSF
jgi:hypothetical protein